MPTKIRTCSVQECIFRSPRYTTNSVSRNLAPFQVQGNWKKSYALHQSLRNNLMQRQSAFQIHLENRSRQNDGSAIIAPASPFPAVSSLHLRSSSQTSGTQNSRSRQHKAFLLSK